MTYSNAPEAPHPAATAPPLTALIARRRRQLLTGLPAISAFGLLGGVLRPRAAAQAGSSSLTFQEIAHGLDAQHHVAPGYGVQVLLRWGDAIRPDAPPFDPLTQSAAAQEKQHGIDSDFITATNGFSSQAEVVIEARRAADLVGATPMDRPEDIEPHPTTSHVYVVLTSNEQRKPATEANARERINPANPRPNNKWGHILELIPPSLQGWTSRAGRSMLGSPGATRAEPLPHARRSRDHARYRCGHNWLHHGGR